MFNDVTFLAAFVAGVLSISSPCILPLIPIYLSHLAGVSVSASGGINRSKVMINAAAYVAGFSLIFVALGLALGAAGSLVDGATILAGNRYWIVRVGGIILMLLGLQQLGILNFPGLGREHRFSLQLGKQGTVGSSFLIGLTFGAGWSPCAGPILGAILTMAAGQGDPGQSAALLATYSAGLAVPFLIFAALGSSQSVIKGISQHFRAVTTFSGAFMLAVGAIMVLGIYQQLFTRIVAAAPWTPWEPSI
jgi:cytochrome c-type biogenesis protein